jgi:predicted phosphodiesterase
MLLVKVLAAQNEENIKINHGPYLQNSSETGISIVFSTNELAVPGVIVWDNNGQKLVIQNSKDGLIDVGKGTHKVRIKNLSPGTSYKYQAFAVPIKDYQAYKCSYGDTIYSSLNSFTTFSSAKTEVNFTVFNDLHNKAKKLSQYLNHNDIPNQDLYFLNGDILGHIDNEKQIYDSFLDTCVNRFAQNIPFFYVRGNHETRGVYARNLKNYLALENDSYYFSFSLGSVRFVVLDGGEDKPDSSKEYSGMADFDVYREQQLEWLNNEIATTEFQKAEVKIVVIHMPVIENEGNWYGMEQLAKYYGPVLNDANIDLMISGHTHENEWIKEGDSGFNYPVIICSNNDF